MSDNKFINSVTRGFNRFGLKIKKYSPELLLVGGIVSGVAATVMACKATTKLDPILEKTRENVEQVRECVERGECLSEVDGEIVSVPYSEKDGNKDITLYYTKGGLEVAKLYAPAILLGAVSVTCLLTSNGIMRKRNLAITAAYMAEHTNFKEYRSRLIDRFGKKVDRELKYNIKPREVEHTTVDENGNEVTETKTVDTIKSGYVYRSPYAVIFNESNCNWTDNAEDNKFFLVQQQRYANDLLKSRGHLFLNEVYDMIGAKRTKHGAQVGWVYDDKNPFSANYVDFGIFDIYDEDACDFVNLDKKVIVLDFNIDGDILDFI